MKSSLVLGLINAFRARPYGNESESYSEYLPSILLGSDTKAVSSSTRKDRP